MKCFYQVCLFITTLTMSFLVLANLGQSMSCPKLDDIEYVNGVYTAPETHVGWAGNWTSQQHRELSIGSFSSSLFFPKSGLKEGILTGCTYSLSDGTNIDLEYHKSGQGKSLSNLVVSIDGKTYWEPEDDAIGIQGYECKKSVVDCEFMPIESIKN